MIRIEYSLLLSFLIIRYEIINIFTLVSWLIFSINNIVIPYLGIGSGYVVFQVRNWYLNDAKLHQFKGFEIVASCCIKKLNCMSFFTFMLYL